jgi:hypothetical protein
VIEFLTNNVLGETIASKPAGHEIDTRRCGNDFAVKMAGAISAQFRRAAPLSAEQFRMPLIEAIEKIDSDTALAEERRNIQEPERLTPIVIGGKIVDPRVDTENTKRFHTQHRIRIGYNVRSSGRLATCEATTKCLP